MPVDSLDSNGVRLIPFECERVPERSTFLYACDGEDPLSSDLIRREIHNSNLLSKYAVFRLPSPQMTEEEILARTAEVGLEASSDTEICMCSACGWPVWHRDSWSPGDELLCSDCDTEVTGRSHPPRLDPRFDMPPADVYHELYDNGKY